MNLTVVFIDLEVFNISKFVLFITLYDYALYLAVYSVRLCLRLFNGFSDSKS